jgi:hypothetical protein
MARVRLAELSGLMTLVTSASRGIGKVTGVHLVVEGSPSCSFA